MKRGRLSLVAVGLALVLIGAACGGDEGEGRGGGGEQDQQYRFGLVLQNFTNPAIRDIADAAIDEAETNFPNVEVIAQDSNNVEEQVAKAETLIAQDVDVLGIEPWGGSTLLPTIQKAQDAGIPVFTVQDDAPGAVEQGLAVSYIAGDEVEGGRLVGEWLLEELSSGQVAIIEGHPGDTPAVARTEGFVEAVDGSDLEIVAQTTANWARDEGLNVATDILTAQPELDAIFAHNDEMAFGALEALRAAGKEDDIILIGYNGTCIGLQATLEGEFQAEGILFLDTVGREFVRNAVAHLEGEEVPPRVQLPITVMDIEQLNAIVDGTEETEFEGLKERLEDAKAGNC